MREGAGGLSKEVGRKGVSPAVDSRRATPSASVSARVWGLFSFSTENNVSSFRSYFLTVLCTMSNLAC